MYLYGKGRNRKIKRERKREKRGKRKAGTGDLQNGEGLRAAPRELLENGMACIMMMTMPQSSWADSPSRKGCVVNGQMTKGNNK